MGNGFQSILNTLSNGKIIRVTTTIFPFFKYRYNTPPLIIGQFEVYRTQFSIRSPSSSKDDTSIRENIMPIISMDNHSCTIL